MKKIILFIIVIGMIPLIASSEDKWIVPQEDADYISFFMFNDDMAKEGSIFYEGSCMSCHGAPTEGNFTLMVPSPGDPGSDIFHEQSDGSMFFKIKIGRESMPGFSDLYSDNEIWSIVAYFRSFNESYIQPKPDLTGIYVPELDVKVSYDYNIDNVVVKVYDKGEPVEAATVAVYVKGYFGNLLLGKKETEASGVEYFILDTQLPGDEEGNAEIIVKVSKGYAYEKIVTKLNVLEPKQYTSAIEGRHLWSNDANAPIWLKVIFFFTVFGVWIVLFVVILQLRKLKKLA